MRLATVTVGDINEKAIPIHHRCAVPGNGGGARLSNGSATLSRITCGGLECPTTKDRMSMENHAKPKSGIKSGSGRLRNEKATPNQYRCAVPGNGGGARCIIQGKSVG